MIIMINGPFGVGKTSVAEALHTALPNSMIFDPEEVGFMLRAIIRADIKSTNEQTDDFQDLELWKVLTVQVAAKLIEQYEKHLIIPMTIYKKANFDYIVEGFKNIDSQTFHFCLLANRETIFSRLLLRGETEGNWCFQQTNKTLDAFKNSCFEPFLITDDVAVQEIVARIMREIA